MMKVMKMVNMMKMMKMIFKTNFYRCFFEKNSSQALPGKDKTGYYRFYGESIPS